MHPMFHVVIAKVMLDGCLLVVSISDKSLPPNSPLGTWREVGANALLALAARVVLAAPLIGLFSTRRNLKVSGGNGKFLLCLEKTVYIPV